LVDGETVDKEGDTMTVIGVTVDDGILVCGETTDEECKPAVAMGSTVNVGRLDNGSIE
jgi:hypothetical protein